MKNLTTILVILFASFSFISVVSAQSEMTILKSFQTTDISANIQLGINAQEIEVVEWDEKIIRLEIKISTNISEDLLKRLAGVGRYELSLTNNSFTMTRAASTVIVKGVEVTENFTVKVFVPKGFSFQIFPSLAHR